MEDYKYWDEFIENRIKSRKRRIGELIVSEHFGYRESSKKARKRYRDTFDYKKNYNKELLMMQR